MLGVMLSIVLLGVLTARGQSVEGWIEETLIPRCVAVVTEGGLGTGVFVTADGYVVTCKHVVANADTIYVYIADFHKYSARVVGYHSGADIAVLKIEPTLEVPYFDLEAGTGVKINRVYLGEDVYAVGMPFGLAWTVTRGIVSQKFRTVDGTVYWQTDTAINPGNSGGPLINSAGQIIGINSIGFPAYAAENVAFAIAAPVWEEEIGLLIQVDRKRLELIENVNEFIGQAYYRGH
jgi:S1-C subfamily serine protease